MIVLGIGGFFHDFNAAAVNLSTGQVSAMEEERFSRKKHHPIMGATSTSLDAVRFVLEQVGGTLDGVKFIALCDVQTHPLLPFLAAQCPKATIYHIDHHTCHAAAAYYSSGMDNAAIVSLDGFGDLKGGLLAHGEGRHLRPVRSISMADSIGLEYLRVTYQIGLGSFGSEGKTQGLAPYGKPIHFEDYMNEIKLLDDGTFHLSDKLKKMQAYIDGEHYVEEKSLFNDFISARVQRRFKDEPIEQTHMDMAASIQKVLDTVAVHSSKQLRAATGAPDLVLTGGVAQNSTMNGVLLASGLYRNVYAHPSSSDRGNALGAALYFVNQYLDEDVRLPGPLLYAGGAYDESVVRSAATQRGVELARLSAPAREAAGLMAEGLIVGWFQGRSELGARALGNRSITADPRKAENKDIINSKVKHREWFRPFAPSVLEEHAAAWFELDRPLPHMQFTVPVQEDKRTLVPAITHVDNSARVQTVNKAANPLWHELISEFHARTGVPLVVNTSFNDAGDPIVETPGDALDCLLKSDLDCVIMGDLIAFNPRTQPDR